MTNYNTKNNALNVLFKRVLAYLFNGNRHLALHALENRIRNEQNDDFKNRIISFRKDLLDFLSSDKSVVPEHLKLSNYRYVGV